MSDRVKIKHPDGVLKLLDRYKNSRQETFFVITLDASHCVIKVHQVTKGLVNMTIVHPRECFFPAIKDNAVSVLFAHNHPSGEAVPSQADLDLTKRLCESADILGFHVLDHVIFTRYAFEWFSLRKQGYITGGSAGNISLEVLDED